MLNSKNLAIAEALAVSVPDADVLANVSPVVVAMANNLEGVMPMEPENYMARIPELSATSPEYNVIADEVTTALAENLRVTFEQIRAYGRGISNALTHGLNSVESMISNPDRMAKNFLMDSLTLEFIRTDHPFYSSLFYPREAPKLALSLEKVSTDELNKVSFTRWEPNQIQSWLNIDNPEINELMMSANVDLTDALCSLGGGGWRLPFKYDEEHNTVDFTQPYMNQAETLFIQYILLSKMKAEDAPFEGLSAGGLEEYRAHIAFLHTAYQQALISLKNMVSGLVNYPIRIVEHGETVLREALPVEGSKMFKRVRAKATVFFNAAGLDMCLEKSMSFTDVAVAFFYRKYLTLEPSVASTYSSDVDAAQQYLSSLCEHVINIAREASSDIYNRVISQVIFKFLSDSPELSAQFAKDGNTAEIQMAVNRFLDKKNYGSSLFHALSNEKRSTEDAIFWIGLPVDFLGFIGCKDACSVMGMTIGLGNAGDCEVTRRENLHAAVIRHFVNKLFTVE